MGRVLTHHYHEDGFEVLKVAGVVVLSSSTLVWIAPEDRNDRCYIREWHVFPGPIAVPSEGAHPDILSSVRRRSDRL